MKPVETRTDGDNSAHPPANVLISAEGNLVMLETNDELWSKLSGIHRIPVLDSDSAPEHFKCNLCTRILTDPVYFACCPNVNYCDECKHPLLLILWFVLFLLFLGIRNSIIRNENSHKSSTCRSCRHPVTMDSLASNFRLAHEIVQFFDNDDHKRQRID